MKRAPEFGFSVMEALAAVALISVALIPLIGMQVRIQRDAIRLSEVRTELQAQRNALAVLQGVNLMVEPVGVRRLSQEQTMRWKASPRSAVVQTTDKGSGDGAFKVALYSVTVAVVDENGRTIRTFRVEQLGWHPINATPRAATPVRE